MESWATASSPVGETRGLDEYLSTAGHETWSESAGTTRKAVLLLGDR